MESNIRRNQNKKFINGSQVMIKKISTLRVAKGGTKGLMMSDDEPNIVDIFSIGIDQKETEK